MTLPASTQIRTRIEELYGAPLDDLEARAQDQPPGMLAALLAACREVAFAEHSIATHRERLCQLLGAAHPLGHQEARTTLDCARRIAEAVAVRDTQAKTVTAVLQSLGRAPTTQAPPAPAPPVPAAAAAPSR
ncbi:hypothetical protein [Streptomyces albus]|uniref:hypothetical protein n=1 Tax=Streptomyces albus TaxID=1888 RepID=UPI003F1CFDC4